MTRRAHPELAAPDSDLEDALRQGLDEVEAQLEKAVVSPTPIVARAASHLISAGGKRFRPMLVLLSGRFGDPADSRLSRSAVAVELTHLATLYHDDVIDEADHRRGIESVNHHWDNAVAVLAGDYLFARASELATELGTDVSRLLARTVAQLCDGQIREVIAAGRLDQTVGDYMEVIRRKTAALIATSCRLGAMMSAADPEVADRLEAFGEALGNAFQLSDDIMDVIASEETLGKEPGVDLKEGVYTLPVLYALQGARGADLRAVLEPGPPSGERLRAALDIVRDEGTLARARDAVTGEAARAIQAAEGLPEGAPREALEHLATFLAARCGADAP